jgi:hypothetical protein
VLERQWQQLTQGLRELGEVVGALVRYTTHILSTDGPTESAAETFSKGLCTRLLDERNNLYQLLMLATQPPLPFQPQPYLRKNEQII